MPAEIVRSYDDVLRAIYVDENNVFVITFDVKLGIAIMSQQQTVVIGEHRAVSTQSPFSNVKSTDIR